LPRTSDRALPPIPPATRQSGQSYLIALGSNMRSARFGGPRMVCKAAFEALNQSPCRLVATSPIVESHPVGPSRRRYANAAATVASPLDPADLLDHLQHIERAFGRSRNQRRGSRWRARILDLDVILWSGGPWQSDRLMVPHPLYSQRRFVLDPAAKIAGAWRDPRRGISLSHLRARASKNKRCSTRHRCSVGRTHAIWKADQVGVIRRRVRRPKPSAMSAAPSRASTPGAGTSVGGWVALYSPTFLM